MSLIKIVKKILKLISHEKSARSIGNVHEADRFAEQITYLRGKYKITQDLIDENQPKQKDSEVIFNVGSKYFRRKRIKWKEDLAVSMFWYYECRGGFFKHSNLKWVEGEKTVRKRVIKTYLHCHDRAEQKADVYIKTLKERELTFDARKLRQNYLLGFSEGVDKHLRSVKELENQITELQRLNESASENQKAENQLPKANPIKELAPAPVSPNNCTALVKSTRIVVSTANGNQSENEKFQPLPAPEIEKIDQGAYMSGFYDACGIQFDTELNDFIEARIKRLEELKEIRRKIEEEKIKANWEQNFKSRARYSFQYPGSQYPGSVVKVTYHQMTFDFDDSS